MNVTPLPSVKSNKTKDLCRSPSEPKNKGAESPFKTLMDKSLLGETNGFIRGDKRKLEVFLKLLLSEIGKPMGFRE